MHSSLGGACRARAHAALRAARFCAVMADIFTGFFIFFVQSTVDLVNCSTIVLGRGDVRKECIRVCVDFYDSP